MALQRRFGATEGRSAGRNHTQIPRESLPQPQTNHRSHGPGIALTTLCAGVNPSVVRWQDVDVYAVDPFPPPLLERVLPRFTAKASASGWPPRTLFF